MGDTSVASRGRQQKAGSEESRQQALSDGGIIARQSLGCHNDERGCRGVLPESGEGGQEFEGGGGPLMAAFQERTAGRPENLPSPARQHR